MTLSRRRLTGPVYDPRIGARRWCRRPQVWIARPLSRWQQLVLYVVASVALFATIALGWPW